MEMSFTNTKQKYFLGYTVFLPSSIRAFKVIDECVYIGLALIQDSVI